MYIDTKDALLQHKNKIYKKIFLRKIYESFYKIFAESQFPPGVVVELGSGGGFLKKIIPNVVTSDVIAGPDIDRVFSTDKIPYKSNHIAGFLMFDVFHHIKDPEKALKEMERCLKPGGKIIMIEPYPSVWGTIVYKYIHPEKSGFDTKSGWKIKGKGRMSDANPAAVWNVFIRDKILFYKRFPTLKITEFKPHTPLRYLVSGGLSDIQLLPGFFYSLICWLETAFSPVNRSIGMFVTIVIEKRYNPKRAKIKR